MGGVVKTAAHSVHLCEGFPAGWGQECHAQACGKMADRGIGPRDALKIQEIYVTKTPKANETCAAYPLAETCGKAAGELPISSYTCPLLHHSFLKSFL